MSALALEASARATMWPRVSEKSPRVLVIEDHADSLEILVHALRTAGFDAHGESDGRAAWDRIIDLAPDAIVVDLFLPRLDGWRLAELVRIDRRWRRTPIVVVTGSTTPDAVQRARDAGADVVLFKPCDPMRVAAEVHAVLARRASIPPAAISP